MDLTTLSDVSPVWTRALGVDPVDCGVARAALAGLGAAPDPILESSKESFMTTLRDGI